ASQRGKCKLDVVVQYSVRHVLTDQHGELFRRACAALESFLGRLVRAILPRGFYANHLGSTDLLSGDSRGGIDIAVLKRATDLVESALAQIALDVLVAQHDRATRRGVEYIKHILQTLQVCSLGQIVVDDQVGIDGGSHEASLFR